MEIRANNPNCDFLISLVRAALLGEPIPPVPQGCTPLELANLIQKQQLTSLVYNALSAEPRMKPLCQLLQQAYLVQIPKITNQEHEIKAWLDAAEEKGYDCIPLKGYLLRKLYPSPLMRSMTDLDVLMRNMDREAVRVWMEGMGYEGEDTHELSHHDNFIKRPWMYMELHFHLMKPRHGRDELEKTVWEHATPLPGYKHIYQMSPEDFYIFHILHLHKHFISRGVGLKSVIDIHVFMKQYADVLDRGYLEKEMKFLQIDDFAAYMERLSRVLLGDEPADADTRMVADYMADCGSFGTGEYYHAIQLARTEGKSIKTKKWKYRMQLLFPGAKVMSKQFPVVGKYPVLLPVFWVVRMVRGLFSKKHRAHFREISNKDHDTMTHILTVTGAK